MGFVPLLSLLEITPIAIIFGILGGKADSEDSQSNAKSGIALSIIGGSLSLIALVIYVIATYNSYNNI